MKYLISILFLFSFFFSPFTHAQMENPQYPKRESYFSQFWDFQYPRGSGGYPTPRPNQEKEVSFLNKTFLSLITKIYQWSPEKQKSMRTLQTFFGPWEDHAPQDISSKICEYCLKKGNCFPMTDAIISVLSMEGIWWNQSLDFVCPIYRYTPTKIATQYINENYLGREYRISELHLSDIQQAVKKEKKEIFRGDSPRDYMEVYPSFDSPNATIKRHIGIGNYLFGIAKYRKEETMPSLPNFDGLMILKKGDTHRQKFATIIDPDLENLPESKQWIWFPLDRALTIKNGKLNLVIMGRYPNEEIRKKLLLYGFELQENGNWELKNCWKYSGSFGYYPTYDELTTGKVSRLDLDSLEHPPLTEKLPLSECNNGVRVENNLS